MRMLLIDVQIGKVEVVEANSLEDYYRILNVERQNRRIGHLDKKYEIICEEEGLCKENPKISAVNDKYEVMLVGNLLIAGSLDDNGCLIPLTDEDIAYVMQYIKMSTTRRYPQKYPILYSCNAGK